MTKEETGKFLIMLAESYRDFKPSPMKVEIYHETLGDINFSLIQKALAKILMSEESNFAPSIATIRRTCLSMVKPESEITASEGWGEVTRAISNFGWSRETEALASMSEVTRRVCKMLNWQEICQSEELGVIRGQFMKMYSQVAEREKQDALIPANMKNLIAGITNKMEVLGDGKN